METFSLSKVMYLVDSLKECTGWATRRMDATSVGTCPVCVWVSVDHTSWIVSLPSWWGTSQHGKGAEALQYFRFGEYSHPNDRRPSW